MAEPIVHYATAAARNAAIPAPSDPTTVFLDDTGTYTVFTGGAWQPVGPSLSGVSIVSGAPAPPPPSDIARYPSAVARDAALPSPTEGTAVYLLDSGTLWVYENGSWQQVGGPPATSGQGTRWLSDTGAPSGAMGAENGDFYVDLITREFYRREAGAWVLHGNLRGATGAAGASIESYVFTVDARAQGVVGPFYGRAPMPLENSYVVESVRTALSVPAAGVPVVVDVNYGGTTIYADQTRRPAIAVGAVSAQGGFPSSPTVAPGGVLTIDLDSGSVPLGEVLTTVVRLRRTT